MSEWAFLHAVKRPVMHRGVHASAECHEHSALNSPIAFH